VTPYHTSERAIFHNGDCRAVMAEMLDNSIDSVVCDPPYEIGFMQRGWDSTGIAYEVRMWQEALRVLKPGGHLLAFGGARTYHRMACAIEDAGFEIRDQIMWVYGSGFPKSLDVSKAIDKSLGAVREVVGRREHPTLKNPASVSSRAFHVETLDSAKAVESWDITAPATNEAKQWQGWGTALKPAHEPIVVARKPLIGTVVKNVLQYGTGALNIGACRIEGEPVPINRLEQWSGFGQEKKPEYEQEINSKGRWPANLILDGSEEVLNAFPDAPGQQGDLKATGRDRPSSGRFGDMAPPLPCQARSEESTSAARFFYQVNADKEETSSSGYEPNYKNKVYGDGMGGGFHPGFGDEGSAARFFYCAKTSGDDRHEGVEENNHPTVKPTALMRYLCRLVTPQGGTVLDPFMGSGSTYKAAYQEGLNFIGIEINEPYCAIAINRVAQNVFDFTS
jgi:DNA modification methylase